MAIRSLVSLARRAANTAFIGTAVACLSLGVAVLSLYVAYDSSTKSNQIAVEALLTARQSNEIALGRLRESATLEFTSTKDELQKFEFFSEEDLKRELFYYISFSNRGKKPVEGATFELIGTDGLTYRMDAPLTAITSLPSIVTNVTFNSAVQPDGSVHLDVRMMLLTYLLKIASRLPDKQAAYHSAVNIVVVAKGIGEPIAVGSPTKTTPRDRKIISIVFAPAVIESEVAKQILAAEKVTNRVFSP